MENQIKKDKEGNEICPKCGKSEKWLTKVYNKDNSVSYKCSNCLKNGGGSHLLLFPSR